MEANFKALRRKCAECGKEYRECLRCQIYEILNTPCEFCKNIGGVVPLNRTTAKGIVKIDVCPNCLSRLT